jgi:hypothetical protein
MIKRSLKRRLKRRAIRRWIRNDDDILLHDNILISVSHPFEYFVKSIAHEPSSKPRIK